MLMKVSDKNYSIIEEIRKREGFKRDNEVIEFLLRRSGEMSYRNILEPTLDMDFFRANKDFSIFGR